MVKMSGPEHVYEELRPHRTTGIRRSRRNRDTHSSGRRHHNGHSRHSHRSEDGSLYVENLRTERRRTDEEVLRRIESQEDELNQRRQDENQRRRENRERESLRLAAEQMVALEIEEENEKKKHTFGARLCRVAKIVSGFLIAMGLIMVFYVITMTILGESSPLDIFNFDWPPDQFIHEENIKIIDNFSDKNQDLYNEENNNGLTSMSYLNPIDQMNINLSLSHNSPSLNSTNFNNKNKMNRNKGLRYSNKSNDTDQAEGRSYIAYIPVPLNNDEEKDEEEEEEDDRDDKPIDQKSSFSNSMNNPMFVPVMILPEKRPIRPNIRPPHRPRIKSPPPIHHQRYPSNYNPAIRRTSHLPYPTQLPTRNSGSVRYNTNRMSDFNSNLNRNLQTIPSRNLNGQFQDSKFPLFNPGDFIDQLQRRNDNTDQRFGNHNNRNQHSSDYNQQSIDSVQNLENNVYKSLFEIMNKNLGRSQSNSDQIDRTQQDLRNQNHNSGSNYNIPSSTSVQRDQMVLPTNRIGPSYPGRTRLLPNRRPPISGIRRLPLRRRLRPMGRMTRPLLRSRPHFPHIRKRMPYSQKPPISRHKPPPDFRYPSSAGSIQDIIHYMQDKIKGPTDRMRFSHSEHNYRPNSDLIVGDQNHIVGKNPFRGNTLKDLSMLRPNIQNFGGGGSKKYTNNFSEEEYNYKFNDNDYGQNKRPMNDNNFGNNNNFHTNSHSNTHNNNNGMNNYQNNNNNRPNYPNQNHGSNSNNGNNNYNNNNDNNNNGYNGNSNIPPVQNSYDTSRGKTNPFNIMLDIYPMSEHTPHNQNNFQTSLTFDKSSNNRNSNPSIPSTSNTFHTGGRQKETIDPNKHEIVLHLNLFSKRPVSNDQNSHSSSVGRSSSDLSLNIPLTGSLTPLDIYQALMHQVRNSPVAQPFTQTSSDIVESTSRDEVHIELFDLEEGHKVFEAIEQGLYDLNPHLPPDLRFNLTNNATPEELHKAVNLHEFVKTDSYNPSQYGDHYDYYYYYDDYDDNNVDMNGTESIINYNIHQNNLNKTALDDTDGKNETNKTILSHQPTIKPTIHPEVLPTPCWKKDKSGDILAEDVIELKLF